MSVSNKAVSVEQRFTDGERDKRCFEVVDTKPAGENCGTTGKRRNTKAQITWVTVCTERARDAWRRKMWRRQRVEEKGSRARRGTW